MNVSANITFSFIHSFIRFAVSKLAWQRSAIQAGMLKVGKAAEAVLIAEWHKRNRDKIDKHNYNEMWTSLRFVARDGEKTSRTRNILFWIWAPDINFVVLFGPAVLTIVNVVLCIIPQLLTKIYCSLLYDVEY